LVKRDLGTNVSRLCSAKTSFDGRGKNSTGKPLNRTECQRNPADWTAEQAPASWRRQVVEGEDERKRKGPRGVHPGGPRKGTVFDRRQEEGKIGMCGRVSVLWNEKNSASRSGREQIKRRDLAKGERRHRGCRRYLGMREPLSPKGWRRKLKGKTWKKLPFCLRRTSSILQRPAKWRVLRDANGRLKPRHFGVFVGDMWGNGGERGRGITSEGKRRRAL